MIPASHQHLIDDPISVVFVTLMPDGQPQATVVWRKWENDTIRISCGANSQKAKNVRNNPLVNIITVDPASSLTYLEIRGKVIAIETDEDAATINAMGVYYTGKPYYGGSVPKENQGKNEHVTLTIQPLKINVT